MLTLNLIPYVIPFWWCLDMQGAYLDQKLSPISTENGRYTTSWIVRISLYSSCVPPFVVKPSRSVRRKALTTVDKPYAAYFSAPIACREVSDIRLGESRGEWSTKYLTQDNLTSVKLTYLTVNYVVDPLNVMLNPKEGKFNYNGKCRGERIISRNLHENQ